MSIKEGVLFPCAVLSRKGVKSVIKSSPGFLACNSPNNSNMKMSLSFTPKYAMETWPFRTSEFIPCIYIWHASHSSFLSDFYHSQNFTELVLKARINLDCAQLAHILEIFMSWEQTGQWQRATTHWLLPMFAWENYSSKPKSFYTTSALTLPEFHRIGRSRHA